VSLNDTNQDQVSSRPGTFDNKLARRLMDALGTQWCGNKAPPLTNRSLYVREDGGLTRVFATVDDGGWVGVGYPDDWQVIMRTRSAHLFAWWVFKTWVADWFGLRSAIYYRALHRWCSGSWKRPGRRDRELVRVSSYDEWRSRPA